MTAPRFTLAATFTAATLLLNAQTSRAQQAENPLDVRSMLETLRAIKEKQVQGAKSSRVRAMQDAQAAISNPSQAADFFEDAYRQIHFEGASRESGQFREWKDGEGAAVREKEVLSALRLYFSWLAITLRKADGATNEQLLPSLLNYTRELAADQAAMDEFDDQMKRDREAASGAGLPAGQRRPGNQRDREKRVSDAAVKKLHDQILNESLGSSFYIVWTKQEALVDDLAPGRVAGNNQRGGNQRAANQDAPANRQRANTGWVAQAGNFDGIYGQLILPTLREAKDARAVEYWDLKLRREADVASRTKLSFEIEKFNTTRRPMLLWNRAQEWGQVGQKNRSATEMFAIIKAFPTHPQAEQWVDELMQILAPGEPPATAAPAAPPKAP